MFTSPSLNALRVFEPSKWKSGRVCASSESTRWPRQPVFGLAFAATGQVECSTGKEGGREERGVSGGEGSQIGHRGRVESQVGTGRSNKSSMSVHSHTDSSPSLTHGGSFIPRLF